MNFDGKKSLSKEIVSELAGLVALLPDYANLTEKNLPELVAIQEFFEKAVDLFAEKWSQVAVIAEQYKAIVESIILGESVGNDALKSVIHAVDMIIQLPLTDNPQIIIQQISNNISIEDKKSEDDFFDLQTPPPMGVLMLNTQEDSLVYNEFISESNDHLETVEAELLSLEDGARPRDVIESLFRAFHSIKGAAGFLGLTAINKLCHESENMLDKGRKGELPIGSEVTDTLLLAKDSLSAMLDIVKTQVSENRNGLPIPEYNVLPLLKKIRYLTKDSVAQYDTNIERENEIIQSKLGGMLVESGLISKHDLQKALNQQNKPLGDIVVGMGAASQEQIEKVVQASDFPKIKETSSIKVEANKLETLLEMAGELIVAHSQVANYKELNNEIHLEFAKNIANLGKISTTLQEQIMSLRLVPIRGLFNKMNRLIRDTAKKTGKFAVLKLFGEDTEVDKTIVDQIADPLVHLLRNSVDHGLETEETRISCNKDKFGVVKLKAYHSGGSVIIEISDDGKGIDPEIIFQKAVNKGFISAEEYMTDKEKLDLIFLPGFSTHDVATDISGRGVGMDVVKKNISSLGGNVEVNSELGKGTCFVIKLPLTMAIVDGMVIKLAGERYVLPTLNIEESIKPIRENIKGITGEKALALQVRGELIPLIELATIFGQESKKPIEEKLVVIVNNEYKKCGLIIDDVQEQQQVVIKNLGKQLKGLVGVSGGCILGDGRVGLILDVASLIKLASIL